ncbi:SMI1/KNR4 family protein [Komagataeibacter xylinus]|uniref:SMI1/KNR4 family protein n=1 Tax=Komagataeibacter xylinus TaxID=28448 RepID=UPI00103205CB|nr:SMI1/KNR4 family protein [Komagataeibacter xylinus]
MINFGDKERNLSNEDISFWEKKLGFSFQNSYKTFIKEYNGSYVSNNYIEIPPGQGACLSKILSLEEVFEYMKSINDKVVDNNYFPFALDDSGNFFLMGKHSDTVYFYDHEYTGMSAITEIAKNLDGFLTIIQPVSLDNVLMPKGKIIYMNEDILNKFRKKP